MTLNHLCWASHLGASCALLAKHGFDSNADIIASYLRKHHIDAKYVSRESGCKTAESTVYVEDDGTRTIFMFSGSIATLTGEEVKSLWGGMDGPLAKAAIVTSEISQIPLCGAAAVFSKGREHGAIAVLDVDVPPDIACQDSRLGTPEQFKEVLGLAHVLKMPKAVAERLTDFMHLDPCSSDSCEIASAIAKESDAELVVVTDGCHGAVGVLPDGVHVTVPAHRADHVRDTTGAGDAFLGGMLAQAVSDHRVRLPKCRDTLTEMLQWGSECASLCVGQAGALPPLLDRGGETSYGM